MSIAIIDYGMGNLRSVQKGLERVGFPALVTRDAKAIENADGVVLPGVGAFRACMDNLRQYELIDTVRRVVESGKPFFGICLGMQLLFEESDEGAGRGLGVFAGRVTRLRSTRLPQIGWNALEDVRDPLVAASGLEIAYYANSFGCRPIDGGSVGAWSTHEADRFAAAVRLGRCVGVQFHPEKSSAPGVRFIHAFLDDAQRAVTSSETR